MERTRATNNMKKQQRKQTTPKPQEKLTHELFRFNIAGVQYSDYQTAASNIKVGDKVDLFWEPSNKFDDKAIRIEWKGIKLGYVPKHTYEDCQSVLHNYREMGIKILTHIVSINKNNPSWQYYVVKCASVRADAPYTSEVEL